jgi:hypothetical protein
MTIAIAGIFKESIVLGADTLTTIEDLNTGRTAGELSHKIEPILGVYALMFAGPKYLITTEGGEGYSINFILRDLLKEVPSNIEAINVFDIISNGLENACIKTLEMLGALNPFESFFVGYEKGTPFYRPFFFSKKHGSQKGFSKSMPNHNLVFCCGLESFKKPNLSTLYYARLNLREGKKLILKILEDTYNTEIKFKKPPRINNRFDIGVITSGGFYWDKYEPIEEVNLLTDALRKMEEPQKSIGKNGVDLPSLE